jgi:hypothetical protein
LPQQAPQAHAIRDDREDLRHSKLSTTMDLYVHAYDDQDLGGAVGALDRALGS